MSHTHERSVLSGSRSPRAKRRRRLYPLVLGCVIVALAIFTGLRLGTGQDVAVSGTTPGADAGQSVATTATTAPTAGASVTAAPATARGIPPAGAPTTLPRSASVALPVNGSVGTPAPRDETGVLPADVAAILPATLPADAGAVDVPILMYHYVADVPPPKGPYSDGLTVRTPDFRQEMQYLADNSYHTVSLADVYLAMAGQKSLPDKAVALTFDDGGLDNYEVAFPILREYGLMGTFFIITKTVDGEGQMTWEQLREMADAGMSIQSHTVSHPDLRKVTAEKLKSELVDSRQAIAEGVGQSSYVLAYPAGAYNDAVIKATRAAGYVMAVTTSKGAEGEPSAVYELKRRRVQPHLPLERFAHLVR